MSNESSQALSLPPRHHRRRARQRGRRIALLSALTAAVLSAAATNAAAQPITPKQCEEVYEQAQVHHAAHKYLAARNESKQCAQVGCNEAIGGECMKLYELIASEMPSLVFSAHDAEGKELFDVQITVDGKPSLARLDGSSFELDPGIHSLRFEAPNLPPLETELAARVGDHHRLVEVTLGQPKPLPVAPPPQAPKAPPPLGSRASAPPVLAYVLTGAGVVALGAFGYLQLRGHSDYNDLSQCKPACNPDSVDQVRSKIQLSYIPLGIGIAAIGAAVTLFIVQHENATPSAEVGLATINSGASARFQMHF